MRGALVRSSRRVPSHYVLLYGKSMSIRPPRPGRSSAAHGDQTDMSYMPNGFEHVRSSAKAHASTRSKNYPSFLEAIKTRMAGGATPAAGVAAAVRGQVQSSASASTARRRRTSRSSSRRTPHLPPDAAGRFAVRTRRTTAEVTGFSAKRVIIEALRTVGDLDEDEMNTTEILAGDPPGARTTPSSRNDVMPDRPHEITDGRPRLVQPAGPRRMLPGGQAHVLLRQPPRPRRSSTSQSAVMPGTGALKRRGPAGPTDGDDAHTSPKAWWTSSTTTRRSPARDADPSPACVGWCERRSDRAAAPRSRLASLEATPTTLTRTTAPRTIRYVIDGA